MNLNKCINEEIKYIDKFPKTKVMSSLARQIYFKNNHNKDIIFDNPDQFLNDLIYIEFELYKALERKLYLNAIREIDDLDEFIFIANSILNRRKARAGKSLENHIEYILNSWGIEFSSQCIIENHRKPDFIFPSIECYNDKTFDTDKLTILACKTTLKERWSQILKEGTRVNTRYLCSNQGDIANNTIDSLNREHVILVSTYSKNYNQCNVISLKRFLNILLEKNNTKKL